ncbi:RHS repeat-associated core domain-containing protein [Pseudoxanthomonas japonensis]|nr:RHS repeat-associated core domain-containing protein [Pseudoxanthomonas japonensis]
MKRSILAALLAWPLLVQAQTYTKTETIEYHDDSTLWVLGQVKRTTTNGVETSSTTYGWKALPWKSYAFGKLQQTLSYDSASAVTTGQCGTLKTAMDGNNNVTTFGSWKRGIPQIITYADSTTQSAVVNNNGWIDSVTDENGYTTCYAYDAMGRLASIAYPSETANACDVAEASWKKTLLTFQQVAVAEYGIPAGHWRQTVSTGAGQKISYYDALWRPLVTKELDATNGTTETLTKRFRRFAYDAEGRVTFASYPGTSDALTKGIWTEYDALGRVTSVSQDSELAAPENVLTTTTQYLTDFKTKVTSPKGQITTTSYQAYDQPSYDWPVAIAHPEGTYTDISRDAYGKVLMLTRRNGNNTAWQRRYYVYNAAQELCKSTETETGTTAYGYDGVGNLSWSAAGLSWSPPGPCEHTKEGVVARRVDRTYDARGRLRTLSFPDGQGNTTNTYAPDGLLASTSASNADGAATTTYTYNHRRLLTREVLVTPNVNWPYHYSYNASGHLASNNWHGLTITYAPNALGQATQAGPYASNVTYHPNGVVKNFTYGNGMVYTMAQNARGLPIWSVDCLIAGNCTLSYRRKYLAYTYDGHGNVATITDHVNGRQTRAMTYDGLDRLTQSIGPGFGTATYTYDPLDNLKTANVTGGNHPRNYVYQYDSGQRLSSITDGVGGPTVVGLGYDPQGNLRNRNGNLYGFDYGNRLRSAPGASIYHYDGHGRRVEDIVGGLAKRSQYTQGGQLVMVGDARANTVTEYVHLAGSLLATRERDVATNVYTTRYHHTDALGTPVVVTGADKGILETSEYEPYGQLVNRPLTDGPGFTGHVQDAATGLTYMQQRYYDPVLGRFLSADPVAVRSRGDNFNRYWYANNNPYTNKDPDGRECNGKGCWVTNAEREAAASGNWQEYYRLAGSSGDRYAQRAGEVASNSGSNAINKTLSNATNKILADSIAINMGADPENLSTGQMMAVEFKMEGVRVGLAKAHVQALDDSGASPSNPVSLDRAVIGEFHKQVFKENGANPAAFGGFKVDAMEKAVNLFGGTTRDIYDYCPSPSCKN